MDSPGGDGVAGHDTMTAPVYANHFLSTGGVITPQPWMQYRCVASWTLPGQEQSFNVTGSNRDDDIHTVTVSWTNDTPIDQWVWGEVTRGGCRVTLQARTRAYLKLLHAAAEGTDAGEPVEVSRMGAGMTLGREGLFANNQFGVIEYRQNARTMPLLPQNPNRHRLAPGITYSALAELRFVSDFWETSAIDGGNSGTECSYVSGDTRIDLFAIPVL